MFNEEDDKHEEVNISDDSDDDAIDLSTDDDGGGEPEDRGDYFLDPDTEEGDGEPGAHPGGDEGDDQGTAGTAPETDGAGVEGDDKSSGSKPDSVPIGRLNEVSRIKSAATSIMDGLVEGEIDAQLIKDLGGSTVVAKAVANREITLDELKSGNVQSQAMAQKIAADSSAIWDMDAKYVEYQELVDLGETKAAATLLRTLNKEERARERAEEQAALERVSVNEFVTKLMTDYPVLADVNSKEHEEVTVWANHIQQTEGVDRNTALQKAVGRIFPPSGGAPPPPTPRETTQQRVLRERREAAVRRGANATLQHPPPMGIGQTPGGANKIDVSKMSDDEFDSLSPAEKARARGDHL